MSVNAVLLAAHAKVLGELTGERDVLTGVVLPGRGDPGAGVREAPTPCRLRLGEGDWRDLVRRTYAVQVALARLPDHPLDALVAERGIAGPLFSTVLDLRGEKCPSQVSIPDATELGVRVDFPGPAVRVRAWYRTDVMDDAQADRIIGYYLTVLRLLAADPRADHDGGSLLSPAERDWQLNGLAGPVAELPAQRFHELFEARVRRHPDLDAAVHQDTTLTYDGLNRWANRIAADLLDRGLRAEDVVAVRLPRGLPWMATVIGILKAGGCYLPVDPTHPADRIASVLRRSEASFLISDDPGEGTGATDRVRLLDVRTLGDGQVESNPGRRVQANQLAYIYFTSGSTGEPKGAMCEHTGMLNHLLAKIEDLGIEAGQTVAQTAPQCSTFRCGSSSPLCWSAAAPASSVRRACSTSASSSTRLSTVVSTYCRWSPRISRSCSPTWTSIRASPANCAACRSPGRRSKKNW